MSKAQHKREDSAARGQAVEAPSIDTSATESPPLHDATLPVRQRLPDTRQSITHKFNVGGHEGYIIVGLFENGRPGEVFLKMAKEGSTMSGMADTVGTLTSLLLQHGITVDSLARKFEHMKFEPSGWTSNKAIPNATSLIDYVFRWMAITFSQEYRDDCEQRPTG
jgi:ribonucleoside-diphosphate reductase alpha chain